MLLIDEVGGERLVRGKAPRLRPSITVRELIHTRVDLELEAATDALEAQFMAARAAEEEAANGLSGSREWRLNGPEKGLRATLFTPCKTGTLPQRDRLLDAAEQGFLDNSFFVLLDDRQADSLDQVIELDRTGEATFLLLTPLQGG